MALVRVRAWLLLGLLGGVAASVLAHDPGRGAGRAAARDHIVAKAVWVDRAGQASFEQARAQYYTPYEGIFNGGYTEAVHWLRLSLAATPSPLVLRISPAWLDEVTLFDPAAGAPRTVGDRHPVSASDHPGLGFSLDLPASQQPRDVWLRLQSTSAHRLQVEAIDHHQLPQAAATTLTWAVVYAALLVIMLALLAAAWIVWRDPVLGAFLARHAVFTVFAMGYMGLPTLFWGDHWPPEVFDLGFSLVVVVSFPVSFWFDIALLSTFNPHRLLLRGARLLMLTPAAVFLLMLLGQTGQALQLNVFLMLVTTVWVWAMALSCRPDAATEQLMSRRMMRAYYTFILAVLMSGLLQVKGLTKLDALGANVIVLHGMVSGLVMMALLLIRSQRQALRSQEMAWQLSQARQEVEAEQRRRQEQSQFLHMLMHELKTPLSVVSFALGTRENKEQNLHLAGRAVQDMKAVIDRCVQADRLGALTPEPAPEPLNLADEVCLAADAVPGLADRLHLEGAAAGVQADRQLLQAILGNLLDNASRYGDAAGPVTVALDAQAREGRAGVRVRVANAPGPAGWPDPQRLFGKYYRSTGAQRVSGSGLGLFLSRQLAATLGGQLHYQPTDTQVQFELWIPQTPA